MTPFHKIIRELRKLNNELRENSEKIIIYDDCRTCKTSIPFEFLPISNRQTSHAFCPVCDEKLRLVRTICLDQNN